MSNQPKWKFLANLGDAHPLTHGGYFVYVDETGVYPAEAEVVDVEDETDDPWYTVYRFVLEPCTYINGILSDNKFHTDHSVWFANHDADHLKRHGYDGWKRFCDIGRGIELIPDEFAALFCSENPIDRATAYREIAEHYGYHEFDTDPLRMRKRELRKRYLEKNGVRYN